MRPLATSIARLDEFALVFDLPVGKGERAVANLQPQPGADVWGIAYELTAPEFERLDRTEGVPRGAYRRVPVSLVLPAGDTLAAFTYQSERGVPGRRPSRRYLGLLLAGARHHGLPGPYVERLRALPIAIDERDRQLELF